VSEAAADRHIVVAIDPSKRPLDPLHLGGELARRLELPVLLVTVFIHHPLVTGAETEGQLEARAAAQRDLLELGRTLDGVTVADAVVLAAGSPARALHELSAAPTAEMIVVGSTTRGAVLRVLPGSVSQQLLSGAACPVAVAPNGYHEQAQHPLATVGVAYDGSGEARQALAVARLLAHRAGARLRIITADESLDGLRAVHDAAVADSRELVEAEGVLVTGDPADALIEQSGQVDVLLAGSRAYGPLGAVLLGGTTRRLSAGAKCPLVIVPRGRSA
jgi:nucleotide-binding universal stress UspA family protein